MVVDIYLPVESGFHIHFCDCNHTHTHRFQHHTVCLCVQQKHLYKTNLCLCPSDPLTSPALCKSNGTINKYKCLAYRIHLQCYGFVIVACKHFIWKLSTLKVEWIGVMYYMLTPALMAARPLLSHHRALHATSFSFSLAVLFSLNLLCEGLEKTVAHVKCFNLSQPLTS